MTLSLIDQALTTLKNVRLTLGLYTISSITSTETLTTDSARLTFNFAHSDVVSNSYGTFYESVSATFTAILTSSFTLDYENGSITFSASKTATITVSGYDYYKWDYTRDRILERFINSTSLLVSHYCNRKFIADTYSEFYKGLGHPKLILNNYPINKITSVKVNSASLTAGIDYVTADSTYLEQGLLVRESGWNWYGYETGLVKELTAPVDNIEVTYSAGYTLATLPQDIENVVLELIMSMNLSVSSQSTGLKSMSQGALSYSWKDDGGKSSILSTLDGYKRAVI